MIGKSPSTHTNNVFKFYIDNYSVVTFTDLCFAFLGSLVNTYMAFIGVKLFPSHRCPTTLKCLLLIKRAV